MERELLRRLADLEAIRDLARRYAHHIWRKDGAAAGALFTEDGEMDTGGGAPLRGSQAIAEAYRRMLPGRDLQPFVHNHVIELDGDRATGFCYLDLRASVEGESMVGSGFYEDEYVRLDAGWRFRRRKLTLLYFVPQREGWAKR